MMDYADEYAAVDLDHWWFRGRQAIILTLLDRYLAPGSRLLDVGCGTGGLTLALARRYDVEAADSSIDAVALARQRGLRVRLLRPPLSLPSGFDAVCAFDVLEHVDDDVEFTRELAGAVHPNGLLVVTVPAFQALWGPMDELGGHRRRYRLRQLLRVMASARVQRLYSTYFNTLLFPAMVLARLLGFPHRGQELSPPPKVLNRLLGRVFTSEAWLTTRVPMPAGSSIFFVGRVRT